MNFGSILHCLRQQDVNSESGQSLIEAAFAVSLLIVVFMGIFEFGQIAYSSIEVANAAKAGVQYATRGINTGTDGTGIQNAASAAAPDLTIVATSSSACVCSDGTASTCSINDCASSHVRETVTVNTRATITPFLRLPGLGTSFTVTGKAVQQCVQ